MNDSTLALILVPLFAWGWWKALRDLRAGRTGIMRTIGMAADRRRNPSAYWLLTIINAAVLAVGTAVIAV